MMRILEILYAVPFMFLVIVLVTFFGRNIVLIFVLSVLSHGWTWRVLYVARR
ncbi:oligopeptide transport system permease protein oppC [Vibrio sp. JCM 19236]|nr:oligopeptide transport system permease protein oppC [Vibrio sp. JCM 19236]